MGHAESTHVLTPGAAGVEIYTIGHSNRSFEDFARLLRENGIERVVDVRRYPGSRKFPHFNRETLEELLREEDVGYCWLEILGGMRHDGDEKDSPNAGIRSPGFRNYADHMLTDGFRKAVRELLQAARQATPAVMCAERFFWKCHRRLLSDYLTAQGAEVFHILGPDEVRPHRLSRDAVITDDRNVVYPPGRDEEK